MRDVHVGRLDSKTWEIEHSGGTDDMPKKFDEVQIFFYLEPKLKPISGFVSQIIDQNHFQVRHGKRQKPTL
jgi:hypothetical protein